MIHEHIIEDAFRPASVVEMNVDDKGERVIILDRFTGEMIAHVNVSKVKSRYVIIPAVYAYSNRLLVVLLDDDGEKDGELVDNVKAAAIDLKTYTPPV